MGISRREYARRRGVAESAVRKAIATGRISVEPDGTIDPAKADQQWGDNTDPARHRGKHTGSPAAATAAGTERAQAATGAAPAGMRRVSRSSIEVVHNILQDNGVEAKAADASGGEVSFLQARLANEIIKAQLAKTRLDKMKGALVERAKAEALVFRLAREERDAWVNWPARVAALMAVELGAETAAVQKVLEAHVRAHLDELAQLRIAF